MGILNWRWDSVSVHQLALRGITRVRASHVHSSGPRKVARMVLHVVFVIFVSRVPKKNDRERRRRCAPWQSSSGHCFAGMLLPDDGALFSDRDRIENMHDENGWLFQSDVPRDGLHSIVVVSIFQLLDTHPEVLPEMFLYKLYVYGDC